MSQVAPAPSPVRCLAVLLAVSLGGLAVLLRVLPDLLALVDVIRRRALDTRPFDEALVEVAELAVTGCAVWLWTAAAVVAVDAWRGRPVARRGVPGIVRRVVLLGCGLALAGVVASPAQAAEARSGGRGDSQLVEGLVLPDRATTTMHASRLCARAARHRPAQPTAHAREAVVVRTGDSLWELARADLGPDAGDRTVAERVREIYETNRSVIGADADLIRPTQRLRMPQP